MTIPSYLICLLVFLHSISTHLSQGLEWSCNTVSQLLPYSSHFFQGFLSPSERRPRCLKWSNKVAPLSLVPPLFLWPHFLLLSALFIHNNFIDLINISQIRQICSHLRASAEMSRPQKAQAHSLRSLGLYLNVTFSVRTSLIILFAVVTLPLFTTF